MPKDMRMIPNDTMLIYDNEFEDELFINLDGKGGNKPVNKDVTNKK